MSGGTSLGDVRLESLLCTSTIIAQVWAILSLSVGGCLRAFVLITV